MKVGASGKNMESRLVVKPKFTSGILEAVVREGADELTLRAHDEGTLRVEGSEWEAVSYNYK